MHSERRPYRDLTSPKCLVTARERLSLRECVAYGIDMVTGIQFLHKHVSYQSLLSSGVYDSSFVLLFVL